MGNIRIIGQHGSGKTTYLAALAYWQYKNKQEGKKVNFTINPLNDDTKTLARRSEDIILQGLTLQPDEVIGGIDTLPFYSFKIEIKPALGKPEEIILAVRDYPGEIFEELDSGSTNPLHQEFIDECFVGDVAGCLILLNEWKSGTDKFYRRVLDRFTHLMESYGRGNNLRLAIAMSKCERGELWPGRLEPEIDLFDRHFPETTALLRQRIPPNNLQFYAISTFGVLRRNDPRPNRVDELGTKFSFLRDKEKWQPYGVISPLYWLSTGKRMRYEV
ncbi:MAG: hypothetical protein ACSI46_18265 [Gloeotrichia echinulata DVL01]|jgi:hypothetical protein|nr:hypothetical protein [Gloeotrichia echinulata DEX184]